MPDPFPTFRSLRRRSWIVLPLVLIGASAVWLWFSVDFHRRTLVVDGIAREYLLYRPSSRDQELKPLVLAFHGFSGNAAGMAKYSKLHELVEREDFYLAYLDGKPTWHSFVAEGAQVSPDVVFFDRLRDALIEDYPIDPARVYLVGMSTGGDFVVYLAQRRSTRVAAVACQGSCVADAGTAERPFPLMIIVGTLDDRVSPSRFPTVPQAFRDQGHVVEVLRPENVGHRWHVPLNPQVWDFLASHRLKEGADAVGQE